jgi:anti-sigma factor RsiW
MSASCREVLGRLGAYAAEKLPTAQRRAVREHLASCADCRREALEADATLLFAGPVPIEDVSSADAARILEGVRAAVSVRQAERRLVSGEAKDRSVGRRRAAAAAVAAVALLTLTLPGALPRGVRAASGTGPGGPVPAQAPAFAAAVSRPPSGAPAVAPTGATVYEIAPGRGPNEPRVVWIVDGSLDI